MPYESQFSVVTSADTQAVEDVDTLARLTTDGLQSEYVQLESSPFRGRWTTVRFDSLVVQFGSLEVAVVRRVRVPADRWAFLVPLHVPGEARWNGRAVAADDIIVCPPRTECLAFDPPATRFAILTAPPGAAGAATIARQLAAAAPSAVKIIERDAVPALRHRLTSIRDRVESGRLFTPSQIGSQILATFATCFERVSIPSTEVESSVTRSRIVRRAEDFFRTHVSEGVSVAQLSSVVGVSERSLRNAFYDVYTMSPKRYMKLWQLHQVRRALRSVAPQGVTVTEAATCHGLYELGRFAGAYKSLFGERPSDTLNRARERQALIGAA
jgi:AraC family ethanolamine operon transcriptional activator